MADLLLIFLGACLVNNLVLDHMLAVDPAVALAGKIEAAADAGLAMLTLAPVATVLGHVLSVHILQPLGLGYLDLVALVLITIAAMTLGMLLLHRISPRLHDRITDIVPLLLVNCSVLGIVLLNLLETQGTAAAIVFGLGAAGGVFITVSALAGIQDRLAGADVPSPFRGVAILLITLGLFSMALMGFSGFGAG